LENKKRGDKGRRENSCIPSQKHPLASEATARGGGGRNCPTNAAKKKTKKMGWKGGAPDCAGKGGTRARGHNWDDELKGGTQGEGPAQLLGGKKRGTEALEKELSLPQSAEKLRQGTAKAKLFRKSTARGASGGGRKKGPRQAQ